MKTKPAPLPAHLFVSDTDAGLYDTRRPDWSATPVRPVYKCHFREIETPAQLKATLRAGDCTWPGCYPLYFIASDGEALSFESVRKNLRLCLSAIRERSHDGWRVVACEVNYEDSDLTCADTGKPIESACGSSSPKRTAA